MPGPRTGACTSRSKKRDRSMKLPFTAVRMAAALGVAVCGLAPAAFAVSKDVEQLQIRVATMQSDIADLQRSIAENAKEIKRLSDLVGEQNAALKKALQDEKLDAEAMQVKLQEMNERLAQVSERVQPGSVPAAAPTAVASPATGPGPAPAANGTLPPPPSGAATPLPGELFSQAYAD